MDPVSGMILIFLGLVFSAFGALLASPANNSGYQRDIDFQKYLANKINRSFREEREYFINIKIKEFSIGKKLISNVKYSERLKEILKYREFVYFPLKAKCGYAVARFHQNGQVYQVSKCCLGYDETFELASWWGK